ncbi:MAG: signal peptidase I [Caldilineaceae bacterium]|nr:signal peptidase I [Caldilineaceae bacterium]
MTDTTNSADSLTIPPEYTLIADEAADRLPDDEAIAATLTDEQESESTESGWTIVRELLETVVLSLVIFLLIRQGIQNYRIESHSMEPNFTENQFVLVNKLAYRFGEPETGDVVVFHNPSNHSQDYIKRVVGLPGDTLEFRDGDVYVNGALLEEPMIVEPTYGPSGEIVISPDHLYVMGDNRDNSKDSRSFGQLSEDLLVGQAWLRIWPFSEWGRVGHQDTTAGPYTGKDN